MRDLAGGLLRVTQNWPPRKRDIGQLWATDHEDSGATLPAEPVRAYFCASGLPRNLSKLKDSICAPCPSVTVTLSRLQFQREFSCK